MKISAKSIFVVILMLFIVLTLSYFHQNIQYIKAPIASVHDLGFEEHTFTLSDGDQLNYIKNAKNTDKPVLLLIHGQGMNWTDYAKVIPQLAEEFQVFAIDCQGHGKSTWNPDKYTAKKMTAEIAEFINKEIAQSVIVAGHSSGGLIAAYLAANYPEQVDGLLLEDAPFFSTEADYKEKTFAYQYDFKVLHEFSEQKEETNYLAYSLAHSYFKDWFPKWLWNKFVTDAVNYQKQHPKQPVHLIYLPPALNRMFESMTYPYDRQFGETFYNQTWFEDYDQATTLSQIKCPTVFLKAKSIIENDLLIGALTDEQANKVIDLIPTSKLIPIDTRDHDIHWTKPEEYIQALVELKNQI